MPSSTLDTSLVDDLVPTIDSLRADLYPAFGVRPYRVYLVWRRWSGGAIHDGTVALLAETEISPPPKLELLEAPSARKLGYRATPHGRDIDGDGLLTEVSLTYTEAELTGPTLAAGDEFLYRVDDAHGQGSATKWFVLASPPVMDRENDIGWRCELRRVEVVP